MANEFSLSVGQAHEIEQAMNRAGQWNGALVKELCSGDHLVAVRELLLKQVVLAPKTPSKSPASGCLVDLNARPFIPVGWQVEKHVKGGKFQFDQTKVKLYLENKQKTGTIGGHKLRELITKHKPFNANLLDWYLKPENQKFIPENWKSKVVFFWGTIYRVSGGSLYVRYLSWGGYRWRWGYYWLGGDWDAYNPALVPASV